MAALIQLLLVFDVEFPLPKLDTLVASDFDAGAMENWGLITGRTTALLLDPTRAGMFPMLRFRKSVQITKICHRSEREETGSDDTES